jgi:hypothetical protein
VYFPGLVAGLGEIDDGLNGAPRLRAVVPAGGMHRLGDLQRDGASFHALQLGKAGKADLFEAVDYGIANAFQRQHSRAFFGREGHVV